MERRETPKLKQDGPGLLRLQAAQERLKEIKKKLPLVGYLEGAEGPEGPESPESPENKT